MVKQLPPTRQAKPAVANSGVAQCYWLLSRAFSKLSEDVPESAQWSTSPVTHQFARNGLGGTIPALSSRLRLTPSKMQVCRLNHAGHFGTLCIIARPVFREFRFRFSHGVSFQPAGARKRHELKSWKRIPLQFLCVADLRQIGLQPFLSWTTRLCTFDTGLFLPACSP